MSDPPPVLPLQFLKDAFKAVPAVKYAIAVGGIIAIIAIVTVGWKIDARVAVLGTVIMFILMAVMVVFAKLASLSSGWFLAPAMVLTWFALLIVMASATLIFTSAFFHWPLDVHWIASQINPPESEPAHPVATVTPTSTASPTPTPKPTPKPTPIPVPAPKRIALIRYYYVPGMWHTVTTTMQGDPNYHDEGILGYIFQTEQPNTKPLYDCVRGPRSTHYISFSETCDRTGTQIQLLGWINDVEIPNKTKELFECEAWKDVDYFVTDRADCENKPRVTPIGHAFKDSK